MDITRRLRLTFIKNTGCFLISGLLLTGCAQLKQTFTYPKKNQYDASKPFLYDNRIEFKGGRFSKDEKVNLVQRLNGQLNDSSRVNKGSKFFLFHPISFPPAYDTAYSNRSAASMKGLMRHLGYYAATAEVKADTVEFKKQRRVTVTYRVEAGPPTLIDTFSYKLRVADLQRLADSSRQSSLIRHGSPVTKTDVLGEINRLVELFRNNGYYKFTADDLRMRGDTSIAALTAVSDDPFETLRILAEAEKKRDSPTIKLALVIDPAADSSRLKQYFIHNTFLYPDYRGDNTAGKNFFTDTLQGQYFIRWQDSIVKKAFLLGQLRMKKGDLFRQDDLTKTINNLSRLGIWQNVNVQLLENKQEPGKLDMIVQLLPSVKYGFETKIEASYSANSNTNSVSLANAGNLLGLSGNVSLQNRNAGRQGIKITHALRTGVELNLNVRPNAENFINSSDVGYNLTLAAPSFFMPKNLQHYFNRKKKLDNLYSKQSFLSFSATNTNRIGLFKLNSFGLSAGYEWSPKANKTFSLKLINIEYSNLYNRSEAFDSTLSKNPFLRYSFNTALVMGSSFGYSSIRYFPKHPNRTLAFKLNIEQSGWFLSALSLNNISFLNKDLRSFIKTDAEAVYTINRRKSALVFRGFLGVGIPIGSSDTTLPFFKQYFGGGPNSMRAWPIRGIGPGSKQLAPYNQPGLSDRTGDLRLELNAEYRKDLMQIIPNTLTLKWALFTDIGNVWNLRNTVPGGGYDSAQFRFKNLYKEIGMNVGTGFRFDFNYVVLRFDLAFRVKRPELLENNGWKLPSIGFDDLFDKLFKRGPNDEFRKWRYENFNFTIGLNYAF